MMKILAINGSHSGDKGFTQFLIEKIFEGARSVGAECETVFLSKIKMNRCLGCQVCHTEAHLLQCVYEDKDDVHEVFEKIKKCDLVIFATPIYVFNMSGLMKMFIERMNSTGDSGELKTSESGLFFHHIDKDLCSKHFAVLITCDNLENETTKNVVSYFKTYSKFMDAPLKGIMIRRSGKMMGYGKDPEKTKKFPVINLILNAFRTAGSELAQTGVIKKSTLKQTNQNVIGIPFLNLLLRIAPFRNKIVQKAKELIK